MSLKNKNQISEYCKCYIDGNRSQKCKRRCNETERGNRKKLNYSGTFIILIHREDEAIKIKKTTFLLRCHNTFVYVLHL